MRMRPHRSGWSKFCGPHCRAATSIRPGPDDRLLWLADRSPHGGTTAASGVRYRVRSSLKTPSAVPAAPGDRDPTQSCRQPSRRSRWAREKTYRITTDNVVNQAKLQLPTLSFLADRLRRPLAKQIQFELTHCALHPEQEPIIKEARIVDSIQIGRASCRERV